jgi:hypothetical protein
MPTPQATPQAAPSPPPASWTMPAFCGPDPGTVAALDKAISLARPNFGSLAKNETADIKGRKHGYLNLPGLYEAVVGALLTQGVVVTNSIQHVAGGFLIVTQLQDMNRGGWRLSEFPVINLSGGSSAVAAAATTAPRINLQLLLGICAQDDEVEAPAAAVAPWNAPAAAGGSWEVPAMPAAPAAAGQPFAGGYDPTQGQPHQAPQAPQAMPAQAMPYPGHPQQAAPQQQQPQTPYANF